jgi:hypothetical protein
MQRLKIKYLLNLFAILYYSLSFAQVGINTDNPRTKLEIAGDMKISNDLDIGTIDVLESSDTSTFLIQDLDNKIKTLDVSNPTGAALGYIQDYIITNPDEDWVLDFDTGVSATDYVMITISSSFDKELIMSPDGPSAEDKFSLPYSATFVKDGTWRIIADYPRANNGVTLGTWTIKTLIFSSDLSKQFGIVNVPMADGTTGSAVTAILD